MKILLRHRHTLLVEDGAFSHKKYYVTNEGHPNHITSSKLMAIMMNWWILPIGGVASGRVCIGKGLRLQPAQQACFIAI